MHFFAASLKKDIARWGQDPMAVLIWLAIPFIIGGLITAMVDRGDGGGPMGTLLIADQDETLLSGVVAGAFAQDQLGDMFAVENVSQDEGTSRIEAGEASGFLTIPQGFQDAFLNSTPVVLSLKTNPSQTILPGIIQDVTEIILDLGFYLHEVFGDEIKEIQDSVSSQGSDAAFAAEISVRIQNKVEEIGPLISPPVLDIVIVDPPSDEPQPDIALLFLPGIVMMALMFAAQGLSGDYWREREQGTLRRLVTTPGLLGQFVFGKAIAATLIITFITGITMTVGFIYHDIAWAKLLSAMSWLVLSGTGFFAWFAALQMLFPNQKIAGLLTTVLLFPLLMMGGSFFPLDVLPGWLATMGRLAPNGFVVDRLTVELTSSATWTFDATSWMTLLAITVSGLAICSWRLQRGFARGA